MAYDSARIDHQRHPLTLVGEQSLQTVDQRDGRPGKDARIHPVPGLSHCREAPIAGFGQVEWLGRFREDLGLADRGPSVRRSSVVSDIGGLPEAAGPARCLPQDVVSPRRCLAQAAKMSESESRRSALLRNLWTPTFPGGLLCRVLPQPAATMKSNPPALDRIHRRAGAIENDQPQQDCSGNRHHAWADLFRPRHPGSPKLHRGDRSSILIVAPYAPVSR